MGTRVVAAAAGAAAALALVSPAFAVTHGAATTTTSSGDRAGLPVRQMERILQAEGTVSSGVLDVEIDRSDLHVTGGQLRVRFATGFQIVDDLYFQSLGHGKAIFNGDIALRPSEIQPAIDSILRHGMAFQAEHQHLYDLRPMVWFVHFRQTGDPLQLARDVHAVIATTRTPLPQRSPKHPTTPLPAHRIGKILGGEITIGENGVVTVSVPRRHGVTLGGVRVSPDLNVANSIDFEPLAHGRAAAVPDFSMTADEIDPVMRIMRGYGWQVGCLYNQETAEQPQLFFSHQFKTGDPLALARQIRRALNVTDATG